MDRNSAARRQLDAKLARFRPVEELSRPARGWLRAVRDALGMTAEQLGARIGVSQPRVLAMEKAEERGAITLATLERAAEALGCRLVYGLVPNEPLEAILAARARLAARQQLEGEGAGAEERLATQLLNGNIRRLWDVEER